MDRIIFFLLLIFAGSANAQVVQFTTTENKGILLTALTNGLYKTITAADLGKIVSNPIGSLSSSGLNLSETGTSGVIKWANEHPYDKTVLSTLTTNSNTGYFLSGYSSGSAGVFTNGKLTGFEFHNPEMITSTGETFTLNSTYVSSYITSSLSAAPGNGVSIVNNATFSVLYSGSDNSTWAKLQAPSSSGTPVALTLFANANMSSNNINGAYTIDIGSNKFSFSTDSKGGHVGFENIVGSNISIDASSITTTARYSSTSTVSASGLIASDNNYSIGAIPSNIQGYFQSTIGALSGVLVENQSTGINAMAAISFRQNGITNIVGTYSTNSTSAFYTPGSLVIEAANSNGIMLNTKPGNDVRYGSISFGINSTEVGRFDESYSLLIGTKMSTPSAILTIYSTTRGALLPRMTIEQMFSISNPEEGLELYNTTIHKKCIYTDKGWEEINSRPLQSAKNTHTL